MLIHAKNKDLYRAWLSYLERVSDTPPFVQRTEAFFKSQNAIPVPMI